MEQNYKHIISYPNGVEILTIHPEGVVIKGLKGIAKIRKSPHLNVKMEGSNLILSIQELKKSLALSFKAEFKKIISSVTHGFFCRITLEGLSYKVEKTKNELIFWLGLSHTKTYKIPETTRIDLESQKTFCIYGVDPKEVTLVSDQILNLKKKEVYKKRGFSFHENPHKTWYSEKEQVKVLNKKK